MPVCSTLASKSRSSDEAETAARAHGARPLAQRASAGHPRQRGIEHAGANRAVVEEMRLGPVAVVRIRRAHRRPATGRAARRRSRSPSAGALPRSPVSAAPAAPRHFHRTGLRKARGDVLGDRVSQHAALRFSIQVRQIRDPPAHHVEGRSSVVVGQHRRARRAHRQPIGADDETRHVQRFDGTTLLDDEGPAVEAWRASP